MSNKKKDEVKIDNSISETKYSYKNFRKNFRNYKG